MEKIFMSEKKRSVGNVAARTFYYLFISKLISLVLTSVAFVVVARLLGPSNYGTYTFAIAYYSLIGAGGTLGVGSYFSKNLSKLKQDDDLKSIPKILANGYSFLFPLLAALALIGFVLSGFVSSHFASTGIAPIYLELASAILFFSLIEGATDSALIGLGKGGLAAVTIITIDVIQFGLSIFLVLSGYGVIGAIIGLLAGNVAGFILAMYYISKEAFFRFGLPERLPKKKEIVEMLRFSMPLGGNNIVMAGISNLVVLMLGLFVYQPKYILGNYGIALKGVALMAAFYGTVISTVLPAFSATDPGRIGDGEGREDKINRIFLYSLIVTLPVIIYMGVFSKSAIYLFLTDNYALAPTYLSIIAFGTALGMPALYLGGFMASLGKTKQLFKCYLYSGIVQIVLLFFLIPRFNAIGAILSVFVIGNLIYSALILRKAVEVSKFRFDYNKIARFVGSGVFVTLILIAVNLAVLRLGNHYIISLVAGLIALAIVYPQSLVLFKVINKEDTALIRRVSEDIPTLGFLITLLNKYINLFLR